VTLVLEMPGNRAFIAMISSTIDKKDTYKRISGNDYLSDGHQRLFLNINNT
jgi:hypothetical protein